MQRFDSRANSRTHWRTHFRHERLRLGHAARTVLCASSLLRFETNEQLQRLLRFPRLSLCGRESPSKNGISHQRTRKAPRGISRLCFGRQKRRCWHELMPKRPDKGWKSMWLQQISSRGRNFESSRRRTPGRPFRGGLEQASNGPSHPANWCPLLPAVPMTFDHPESIILMLTDSCGRLDFCQNGPGPMVRA
jgi:hypothetical protein